MTLPPDPAMADDAGLTSEANAVLTLRQRIKLSSDAGEKRYLGMILRRLEATRKERDAMKAALEDAAATAETLGRGHAVIDGDRSVWCDDGMAVCKFLAESIRTRAALSAEAPGRKE